MKWHASSVSRYSCSARSNEPCYLQNAFSNWHKIVIAWAIAHYHRMYRFVKKTISALVLLGLFVSHAASAQTQECSAEALMTANQEVQIQMAQFAEQRMSSDAQNSDAMAEMESILQNAGVNNTIAKHADELEMMEPGSNHQPSQALCDDMYAMNDRLSAELKQRQ